MNRRACICPLSVEAARHEIYSRAEVLPTERVTLPRARGRILRESAHALEEQPPFDTAAMDGYAARSSDLAQPLRLVGEVRAGSTRTRSLKAGQCVSISTGAALPRGADCVIRREDAHRDGRHVRARSGSADCHVRRKGENIRAGALLVPLGTRLGAPELAALAAAGISRPVVARAPRCLHLVLGDELVAPNRKPAAGQIRDSNSTLIASLLDGRGAKLIGQRRVRDDLASAKRAAESKGEFDVLLISGGAGPGAYDLAAPLLRQLGFVVHFRHLNLRPGKPLAFASRGRQLAFALPGNPVSHWVVFQLFVGPLLDYLQRGTAIPPVEINGLMESRAVLPRPDTRDTYWPCLLAVNAGLPTIEPLPLASSGDAARLAGARALLPILGGMPAPGRRVRFIYCP